jgi:hypothetical protein
MTAACEGAVGDVFGFSLTVREKQIPHMKPFGMTVFWWWRCKNLGLALASLLRHKWL